MGAFRRRRQIIAHDGPSPPVHIDLSLPRDRRTLGVFIICGIVFLLISAIGSYSTYHYTESVQFCGQTCHGVMKPEFVTYSHSPHAKVACAECHVGKGAGWYVQSKLSGSYQLYSVVAKEYSDSDRHSHQKSASRAGNLRGMSLATEVCGKSRNAHIPTFWAMKRTLPFTVRMIMKVGGGDPTHGPVGGINWHMNVANKIEYLPADPSRQKIPYVRMTDFTGSSDGISVTPIYQCGS